MIRGIVPIVLLPFLPDGGLDEAGLRRVVQFELEGGVHGIGVNGFATEAYKLSDAERLRAAEIVATEVAGAVPLVIGMAPGSTAVALQQLRALERFAPAALMMLPPCTMDNGVSALVEHYLDVAAAADTAIMVQQSPHIPAYRHCLLPPERLAEMAEKREAIRYFKIEGPGSSGRIRALRPLIDESRIGLFGGGGGITFVEELRAGAAGLIPGVGFNEIFLEAFAAWQRGDVAAAEALLERHQPLVAAVSGAGHEHSLHARKHLLARAGLIESAHVRRPTVPVPEQLTQLEALLRGFDLRLARLLGGGSEKGEVR